MPEVDFTWRGETVRFDLAEDVVDREDVLAEASYALLFVESGDQLESVLGRELASRGLAVGVQRLEVTGVAAPMLVISIRCDRASPDQIGEAS